MLSTAIPDDGWPPHTLLEPEIHPTRILFRGECRFETREHGAARRSFLERGRQALWMIWFTTREYELEVRISELARENERLEARTFDDLMAQQRVSASPVETELLRAQFKISQAMDVAMKYGGIDEAHHKAWVIDQVLRYLLGDEYDEAIALSCAGDDGPDTHTHDVGIPP